MSRMPFLFSLIRIIRKSGSEPYTFQLGNTGFLRECLAVGGNCDLGTHKVLG